MVLDFSIVSLMPEMFRSLDVGVTGRAIEQKKVRVQHFNPRDWSKRAYRQIDDKSFGGGPGMVMMYEPLTQAISAATTAMTSPPLKVYLSPQGAVQRQARLRDLVERKQAIVFVAGRYEGIDQRVIEHHIDEEWSLGDFVLSGGELAAMVYMDAMIRLLPGALGHVASASEDSFSDGLLDHPHYTRPASIDGYDVPSVLLQGNHRDITRWRRKQALGQTWIKRPELLSSLRLSENDTALLNEFKHEYEQQTLSKQ
jgi:tRNA (guanine37-N1)-methyltransferase